MSISHKLNYLLETKNAIRQAISDKGQDIPADLPFRSYAEKILAIESGEENFKLCKVAQQTTDGQTTLYIMDENTSMDIGEEPCMLGVITNGTNVLYLVEV